MGDNWDAGAAMIEGDGRARPLDSGSEARATPMSESAQEKESSDLMSSDPHAQTSDPSGDPRDQQASWQIRRLGVMQARCRDESIDATLGSFQQSESLAYAVALEYAITALRHQIAPSETKPRPNTAAEGYSPGYVPRPDDDALDVEQAIYEAYMAARGLRDTAVSGSLPFVPLMERVTALDKILDGLHAARRFVFNTRTKKALQRPSGATWEPIETAPKDGTWLLGWHYDFGHFVFRDGPGFVTGEDPMPTHWMPLPPVHAPSGDGK